MLVKGPLANTMLSTDLVRLVRLEGCLAGNVPEQGLRTLPPGCRELKKLNPAKVVFGPGTFINTAVNQINDRLTRRTRANEKKADKAAAAARKLSAARGDPPAEQERLAPPGAPGSRRAASSWTSRGSRLQYGITGIPNLSDRNFVASVVFDPRSTQPGVPKSRFAYLFPSQDAALVQVRLRPGLSDADRGRAIDLIREVTRDPQLTPEHGGRYVVSGVPVVVEGLADEVRGAIFLLLGAALLVMAATLALVFRTRLRLLPLAVALAAAAMTFGALALVGGSLTMATIAALPVLIGLAVDYAIQFQARHDEVARRGRACRRRRPPRGQPRRAAPRSRPRGSPPRWDSSSCSCPRSRWCAASGRSRLWASCWRSRARSPLGSRRSCASGSLEGPPTTCRPPLPRVRASVARGGRRGVGVARSARQRRAAGGRCARGRSCAPSAPSPTPSSGPGGSWPWGSPSRSWDWRWTRRARSSPTSASSCRGTCRRSRT